MEKIGIIGLGYVGLPLAVEFGKILDVVGFDINQSRIDELKKGIDRTLEVDKRTRHFIKVEILSKLRRFTERKLLYHNCPYAR
jgi:UDP-N-acetyl-D-mannosaminuronate dehydrogenase